MPAVSQLGPGEEFPAGDDSLTAAEVAALAAADRADEERWTPAGWPEELEDGLGFAEGGLEAGAGFAEGGVLDGAAPSLMLAGFAEEAYRERGRLDDDRLTGVMRAYRRLAAQAQARELALIAELGRRRPQPGTPPAEDGGLPGQVSEFLADEVAVALTLTTRAAGNWVGVALGLAGHGRTAAALEAGRIDLPKALVLLDLLGPLEAVTAAAIEVVLLPLAGGLTTGQLRAWAGQLVLDLDPAAARRRREAAARQAHVACWQDPEGTATLAGRYLPPAQVLAADRRLCAIAAAWKKHGAHGGMDLLRAHAYLALLLGHDVTAPPAALLTPHTSPPDPGSPPATDPAHAPAPRTAAQARDQETDQSQETDRGEITGPAPAPAPAPAAAPAAAGVAGVDAAPPLWLTGTVNVTIPLATLLGLADRPGEAAGFGPLHADTARDLTGAMSAHPATRWNVIITDPGGRAMAFGGPARQRPVKPPGVARGSPSARGPGGWTITLSTEPIAPYREIGIDAVVQCQ